MSKWPATIMNLLWRGIKALGKAIVGKDFAALAKFVSNEVKIVESTTMTGEEKRKAVQREARAWLKERGVEVRATLLNMLIEIAVGMMNK